MSTKRRRLLQRTNVNKERGSLLQRTNENKGGRPLQRIDVNKGEEPFAQEVGQVTPFDCYTVAIKC